MRYGLATKALLKLKIPTLLRYSDSNDPKHLPVLTTDSQVSAKMVSEHFMEKGFKNPTFCGFDIYEWSEERKYYFDKFDGEAGIKTFKARTQLDSQFSRYYQNKNAP